MFFSIMIQYVLRYLLTLTSQAGLFIQDMIQNLFCKHWNIIHK